MHCRWLRRRAPDPLNLLVNTIVGKHDIFILIYRNFHTIHIVSVEIFYFILKELYMKHCLTIAGSDCSGGAGIQADLKTFGALGCYGMSVITAVVAENTAEVISVESMPAKLISEQIDAVFDDIRVDAVKTGMLPDAESIRITAEALKKYNPEFVVCDPVMVATSGGALMQNEAVSVFIKEMLPLCTILTPNIPEAEAIVGRKINNVDEMKSAAAEIQQMGAKYVLVKGGHLTGDATDILYDGSEFHIFSCERVQSTSTHGTGCTLSSAIAAFLAKGDDICDAVADAKEYLTGAIAHGCEDIGAGNGPTNHFYRFFKED